MRTLAPPQRYGASASDLQWPDERWWASFGDAELDRLVAAALASQPNLHIASARIVLAQAAVAAADSAAAPRVDAALDLTDQRFTRNGLVPPPVAGTRNWINSAQLAAGWDADLFGRQRAALEANLGQLRAAQADEMAARELLASSVAAAYFDLARLVESRDLAVQSQSQREQVLALTRQRVAGGLDSAVDLRQAESLLAQARVDIEALNEAAARARHALAELVGTAPRSLDALAPRIAVVPAPSLPSGLPVDLVGRRADIVAQRWRVEAALHNVDMARAQFYPNVNLIAFVGLSSIGLNRFLEAASRTYGVGPALRLPIFDAGQLRANLASKGAEADIAIEAYNATLLRALREVADALSSMESIAVQAKAQADATAAADAAFDLATQRYAAGLGNFLVVLTAQTTVLAQRRAATELKTRQLTAQVALIRALGGGYEAGSQTPPARARTASN